MTGLLTALLLGAALSVTAAGLAWLAGLALQSRMRPAQPGLWRSARLVAVLPLLIAPALYAIPQTVPGMPALDFIDEPAALLLTANPGVDAAIAAPSALVLPSLEWMLVAIYALGLIAALALAFRRHGQRRRLLRDSRIAARHERILLDREAEKLGLPAPELRFCSRAATPFLTGWRGLIIAPESLLHSPELARHALVHELCHLHRGDERDRLVGSALTILFWFNWPLRQIERELDAAREIACDRHAIAALGHTQRRAYAATLIETMRTTAQPVSAFGPHDRRHREMRIKAILSGGQTVSHSLLTAGALLLLAVPVAFAQTAVTPRRVVSAPVDMIAPQAAAQQLDQAVGNDVMAAIDPQADVSAIEARIAAKAPRAVAGVQGSSPAPAAVAALAVASQSTVAPNLSGSILQGRITSAYGPRPERPVGSPPFHGGIDIAAPVGTALTAAGAGRVTHAAMGYNGSDRWGNTVEIDHGNGWSTLYAHLDEIDVQRGGTVSAGQIIGTVGSTGVATGPHVHVEVHHDGQRVDPADYLTGLN
ncbi:M23/M56 family metallopeptidase [uncultured Maricaulis sp.]|uniref:M23/M56 family metallopeptidase n=1 Tax=uncultured Maricaulis sp. TaxID=174710 RepID=UPI0030D91DB8|tara:strand:+ start:109499 stop:111112 length:1614 start_codon:yes stop_codon:yes gene_type:complete